MRKYFLYIGIAFIGFIGCKKNSGYIDTSLDATGARVKFIHASWNAPTINFYGNDTTRKFTAVAPSSTNIVQGFAYGAVYPSLDYTLLPAYNDSIRIKVPSNSATFPNFYAGVGKLNVEPNKNYSVFLVDSFPAVSTLIINDTLRNFNSIPDSTYDSRFVNTIFGLSAIDVFSKRNNAVIFSNIPYKGYSRFTNLPVFPISDTLEIRVSGTTTTLIRLLGFTPGSKKTYTWFTRGRYGSAVPAMAPTIGFYTNQ